MRNHTLLLGAALLATGCDGSDLEDIFGAGDEDEDDGGDGGSSSSSDMLTRDNYTVTSNNQGKYKVEIDVDADVSAFMVTVEGDTYPTLERVLDPDGEEVLHWEDWLYGNESLTYAFYMWGKAMAFNWPVREEDGPLAQGTWKVEISTLDSSGYYDGGQEVEVTVHTKSDQSLRDANVRVRIVWAEGIEQDEEVVAAIEDAVERWREVWGNYGLTLEESYHTSGLDADLPFWNNGSNDVEENAEAYDGQELFLIVGESVEGDRSTYGVSGGIPGSIEPNRYSYVVLSWLAHAGGNGSFSDDEIRLMGETMAHECGHFAGLFHPVESDYQYYDALDDTDQCSGWQTCENQLGTNLMFPYPICAGNSCDPQGELTEDQEAVSQRYIGAL